ncbi:acyltransferase family protein [Paenibacillus sp. GCM10023250]|uniref:acyltransferase family protein n=1 Tax=Paenibacillus sp. GCM10023250 TaxID=3252648 RepID=UPI003624570D
MPKPFGSSRYMPGLDGLRAIAVIAVIAYHLNLPRVPGGLLGVGIFFVLSGYLITDILLKQHAKAGRLDLRDFWLRRARRLLPAMLIMLALVSGWLLIADPARLAAMKGEVASALLYYSNWRLIFHDVSYFESFGPPSPLGHLWSLAVEEQFYLVWPLALVFLVGALKTRGRLLLAILAGAAASAGLMALLYVPGLDPSRVYYGTDTRAFGLLIGAALAVVWPSWKLRESISLRRKLAVDALGAAGLAAVALMIATVGEYDAFLYQGGMVVFSLASAAVVAAMAHPASGLARAVGNKALLWLGARSYGIYLYHYPVIALSTPAAQVEEFHPLRAALQVLASVALAELSWRWVEEPIRRGAIGRLFEGLPAGGRQQLAGRRRGLMLTCICALVVASASCSSQGNHVQGDNGKPPAQTGETADAGAHGGNAGVVPAGSHDADGHEAGAPAVQPGTGGGADSGGGSSGSASSGAGIGGATAGGDAGSAGTGQGAGGSAGHAAGGGSGSPAAGGGAAGQPADAAAHGGTKPPAGTDGSGGGETSQPPAPPIARDGVTVIGDSVILDAQPFLEELVPGIVVEGKVGRQLSQADDVVADLKQRKRLGKTVVIELGTNGSFTQKQLNALMDAIGDGHTIYFVNTRVPRSWQDAVNGMLADTVAGTPNAKLIDWYAASKNHEELFGKDGVHLKRSGGEFFAKLIAGSLE